MRCGAAKDKENGPGENEDLSAKHDPLEAESL